LWILLTKGWGRYEGAVVTATLSGVAAEATGGDFAQGALTGAIIHLYNATAEEAAMSNTGGFPANLKDEEVEINNLNYKLEKAASVITNLFLDSGKGIPLVTSGNDGVAWRNETSSHLSDNAFDIRAKDLGNALEVIEFGQKLQIAVGETVRVYIEINLINNVHTHYHIVNAPANFYPQASGRYINGGEYNVYKFKTDF
jgi:hypothetical protein